MARKKDKPVKEMEGGFRLERIKRIKNWLYTVQLMIIVVFVIAIMYTSGDFSVYPFHLGVPSFLYFVLFMAVVLSVEGVIFIRLESRFLKSPSSKYYLLKRSIKKCFVVILVSAIVALLFYLPMVNDGIKSFSETEKTYTVSSSNTPEVIKFTSSDAFGLTNLNFLSVTTNGDDVWVFIVSQEDFDDYASQGAAVLASYRINNDVYEAYPGMEYNVPDLDYGKYCICLYSPDNVAVQANVVMNHELSSQLIGYVPIFCVILIALNIVWVLYLNPLKKLFENRAIYR